MNVAINIAVVIPAHNEEMVLPNLLDDLLHQSVFPYQAIVVNSSSTDGTATIVDDYAARTQWLNLVSGPPTAGAARNEGAMHASTPWLLFLDADVRIPKYFIEEFMRHVDEASFDIYTSRFTASNQRYRFLVWLLCRYFRLFANTSSPALVGHCILVRSRLHTALNGFSSTLTLGEDHDYAVRASRLGARIIWLPNPHLRVSSRRFEGGDFRYSLVRYGHSEIGRISHLVFSTAYRWMTLVVKGGR